MSTDRNEKGVFLKGHTTSEEIKKKISATLDQTGDIAGQRFHYWTVLEKRLSRNHCGYWLCRCDCGTIKEVMQRNLVRGTSKACPKCSGRKRTASSKQKHTNL